MFLVGQNGTFEFLEDFRRSRAALPIELSVMVKAFSPLFSEIVRDLQRTLGAHQSVIALTGPCTGLLGHLAVFTLVPLQATHYAQRLMRQITDCRAKWRVQPPREAQ
jgi:hypothetical protein